MFKKLIFICLAYFFLLPVFISPTQAGQSDPFKVDYINNYTILPNGDALVRHNIDLINKISSIYITNYSFTIFHPDISRIKVYDKNGNLEFKTTKGKKQIKIEIHFKKQVVGLGKKHSFIISYLDKDVSQQTGRVWELNIPLVDKLEKMNSYQVKVKIPASFPPLLKSYPQGQDNLEWSKVNLIGQKGIKIIFGDYQVAGFNLNYYLDNKSSQAGFMTLALPPDTDYQKVIYQGLKPKPINVSLDEDGNWLAKYYLSPQSRLKISAKGRVWIFLRPHFPVSKYLPFDSSKWLTSTDVWPVNNKNIDQISSSFHSIRQVYKYVVAKLDYNYKRAMSGPDRMGALGALKNPDLAVCMEYTDLFITLARSIGVPAREINGYALTSNSLLKPLLVNNDILHAWPEYYDFNLQAWRQVDPTWEDTTGGLDYFYNFDLNHITFVIHGTNPYYPLPVGAYKDNNQPQKDVRVWFLKDKLNFKPKQPIFKLQNQVGLNLLDTFLNTKDLNLNLKLENPTGQAIYLKNLKFHLLSSDTFTLRNSLPTKIILPPFSHKEFGLWLSYKPTFNLAKIIHLFRAKQNLNYQIGYNNQLLKGQITIQFNLNTLFIFIALAFVLIFIISTIAFISWRLRKQ